MRRGRILILLGLILAGGTALAVFVLLRGAQQQPAAEVERVEVVIAKQPIAEDEAVEGKVELRPMPKDSVPEGAIRSLDSVVGLLAAGPIPQGTILHPDLLISPLELAQEGQLGKIVEEGLVAVAFPINELSSVSYGIQPGDHVDVLMTFFFIELDQDLQAKAPACPPLCPGAEGQMVVEAGGQYPRLATQLTVQNVEVLGVGRWAYAPQPTEEQVQAAEEGEAIPQQPPSYITLMLTPQDALVLKLARESGSSIELAVRAEDDLQLFTTQQVTLDYILARFGVSMPAKQPYAIEHVDAVRAQRGQ
jgi:pilus assembly protein CpaB